MKQFLEAARLDAALKRGDTSDPALAGLVRVARKLEASRSVPSLEKEDFNTARAAFLTRAAFMAPQNANSVVKVEKTSWLSRIKENFSFNQGRIWAPVAAIVALIIIFFAAFGIPRLNSASQTSLPGDPLYTYKIVKEDLSASLTFDAYQKVQVYLGQIKQRSDEIASYAKNGEAPPPQTVSRLEKLFDAALRAAALLPNPEMQASLNDIKQASENLSETIAQAKPSLGGPSGDQTLDQAALAAMDTVALADQGLRDPDGFRVNMAAPKPVVYNPTSTLTAKVVYPPIEPTPILRWPTPTVGVMNPPLAQPTPTCTCEPTQAVQEPILPSSTATQELQPTATNTNLPPILPTPTELYMQPTQIAPTPTPTPTPDAGLPIGFPTPTPMQMQDDGN